MKKFVGILIADLIFKLRKFFNQKRKSRRNQMKNWRNIKKIERKSKENQEKILRKTKKSREKFYKD